ncbi:hypothetical protein VP01_5022g2, partial [Puccinia sorghi]
EGGSIKYWTAKPKHYVAPSQVLSSYRFLHSGLNVVLDPLNEDSIIAIIKLNPFEKLTPSEKDDLNFISNFLHKSKQFISPFGTEDQILFNSHYFKSSEVGEIIGEIFRKLAHEPFQKNDNLMKNYNFPSFSDLSYGKISP